MRAHKSSRGVRDLPDFLKKRIGHTMPWYQRTIRLPPVRRGMHLITAKIVDSLPEIRRIRVGMLHLLLQHTSASLTINENADPDVRIDLESSLNTIGHHAGITLYI